jgi:uncharacterized membrane protein YebE (DUF533 family)
VRRPDPTAAAARWELSEDGAEERAMSLMKTLGRVAMGVAVAKGVSSMTRGRSRYGRRSRGLLGGSGLGKAGGAAALASALAPMLSGRGGGRSGGLGGLMTQLGGAPAQRGGVSRAMGGSTGSSSGGLDGLLGGLLGGAAGGVATGGLLGQLAGRAQQPSGEPRAPFGEVLNASIDDEREDIPPTPEQEAAAGLMLRAMIQAARADGEIDAQEREILFDHLDGLDPDERRFVDEEMMSPADPEALARDVPEGLERQVYAASLMAIDVDHPAEVDHLRRLAAGLRLDAQEVAAIHDEVGIEDLPAA